MGALCIGLTGGVPPESDEPPRGPERYRERQAGRRGCRFDAAGIVLLLAEKAPRRVSPEAQIPLAMGEALSAELALCCK